MGVILQGFYKVRPNHAVPAPADGDDSVPWWWDHLATQAAAFREAGFSAIWLPPPPKSSAGASQGADDFPTISVSASLSGASPEIMASSVAQPLERQFADLPGVNQITSTSIQSTTSITLVFDLSRNIDGAAAEVQAAIEAGIPPSVKLRVVSDRSLSISASFTDVQLTLCFTVVLVVLVIFAFLRSFWAMMIPSVAIPLALVGTFAVLYLGGYSLDNLSLMALTLAVGLVVDDAIVMLENIFRYLEQGDDALTAALKGSGEIGFTIVSITVSLIAVFIPLLFMSGIVGRLFREFGVTVAVAITIMLISIVEKTAIMMVDFALERRRHEQKSAEEAIYEAAVLRFRPIIITTMSTIFGTLPIAIGSAPGRICASHSASPSWAGSPCRRR
jgi:multidrug efflux pump subunit AcrB